MYYFFILNANFEKKNQKKKRNFTCFSYLFISACFTNH